MPEFTDTRLACPKGQGLLYQVSAGVAAIRETPAPDGRLATQALHGEVLALYDQRGGFALARCERDHYVGWVAMDALSAPVLALTHKVGTLRTHAYAAPDLKSAPQTILSLGARVSASATEGDFVRCERAGWVHMRHLVELETLESDPVTVAEQYLHTPYLWGGRDSLGLDCTGLTQQAFEAAGVLLPRDSDMQFAWAGDEIVDWKVSGALKRGDIVFWKGHAGIMTDSHNLLHANAWHMAVAREPLDEAVTRIKRHYAEPIGARRIDVETASGQVPAWMAEPAA